MLTGTHDFSYVLDQMIEDSLLVQSSTTTGVLDKADMLRLYDGYQLKFSMFNMVLAVDATDETNAICLASQDGGGAHCAGVYHDGSSVKSWARWVPWTNFFLAALSGSGFSDPEGIDDTSKWFLLDPTMDPDVAVTGTAGSNWSTYRFQTTSSNPINDHRFTPSDTDVTAWVYVRHTITTSNPGPPVTTTSVIHHNFYGPHNISLQGSVSGTVMGAFVAASVLAYSLF